MGSKLLVFGSLVTAASILLYLFMPMDPTPVDPAALSHFHGFCLIAMSVGAVVAIFGAVTLIRMLRDEAAPPKWNSIVWSTDGK